MPHPFSVQRCPFIEEQPQKNVIILPQRLLILWMLQSKVRKLRSSQAERTSGQANGSEVKCHLSLVSSKRGARGNSWRVGGELQTSLVWPLVNALVQVNNTPPLTHAQSATLIKCSGHKNRSASGRGASLTGGGHNKGHWEGRRFQTIAHTYAHIYETVKQ